MRFALLTLLAGCQLVLPYEGDESVPRECVAGHDEDGDGTPDCDDPCPIKDGDADQDLDGDGVGEGCDPSSGTDRIAFFDPFVANRDYARFEGSRAGDHALFGESGGALLDLPLERFRIYVGFEFVEQPRPPGGFGVVFGATTAPAESERTFDGNYCQPYKTHDDMDLLEFEQWQEGQRENTDFVLADWVGENLSLAGFTGTLELDVADRLTCTVAHAGGVTVHSDERRVEPGAIAVYTFNATIRLAYLLVVERGD